MANDVKLQEGHPLDENLRPLKVGGEVSSLNIAKDEKGARITGDLEVQGNIRQDKFHLMGSDSFVFNNASVGFKKGIATYDATDTDIDFRETNKILCTFGSGNITNIRIYYPSVSGNFMLLLKQDGTGSRTITNYRSYNSMGGIADGLRFAGGSNPTLTTDANHVDIISIFWDADEQLAYGVASLDFQF